MANEVLEALYSQEGRGTSSDSPYVITHYLCRLFGGELGVLTFARKIWGEDVLVGFPGEKARKGSELLGWVSAHWFGPPVAVFRDKA